MRIIAGANKGLRLKAPRSLAIRPTSGRAKEALFSILQPCIVGSRFLDIFAGTGSVGLEALSRGAKETVFLEKSPVALRILRANISLANSVLRAVIIPGPVSSSLLQLSGQGSDYNLVFLDPPYFQNMVAPVLEDLARLKLVAERSVVIAESHSTEKLPLMVGSLNMFRRNVYGDTSLNFYMLAGR